MKKKNIWEYHFEEFKPIIHHDITQATQVNAQAITHWMEKQITKNPHLWIWHYDRFSIKRNKNN